jgi:hypothetical protein
MFVCFCDVVVDMCDGKEDSGIIVTENIFATEFVYIIYR